MACCIEKQKKRILECLGHAGFSGIFADAVTFAAPLRYEGYQIAHFHNFDAAQPDDNYVYLNGLLREMSRTYRFPNRDDERAAAYFWLWRHHGKGTHFEAGLKSLPDFKPAKHPSEQQGAYHWSLFHLLYLDSLTWSLPKVFQGYLDPWNAITAEPRFRYVYQEVCRQLCGVRTGSARVFSDRTISESELKSLCKKTPKAHWAAQFKRSSKDPALVLALSFYANGYASYKTNSNGQPDAGKINEEFLYQLADEATRYTVNVPEEDWDARTVFFILALWLFFFNPQKDHDSLERRIFAILYLRFYRQGVDGYFGRQSIGAIWDSISYDKKEEIAASYRKLLAETRSHAAQSWPDFTQSDTPEIDGDYWGSIAFKEVFADAFRANDQKMIKKLLAEHKLDEGSLGDALLWFVTHTKDGYTAFLKKLPKASSIHLDSLTDDQLDTIRSGWSIMSIGDLEWSRDTLARMLSPEAMSTAVKSASILLADANYERTKACLDILGLDPDGGLDPKRDEYHKLPIYHAAQHNDFEKFELLLDCEATIDLGSNTYQFFFAVMRISPFHLFKELLLRAKGDEILADIGPKLLRTAFNTNNPSAIQLLVCAGVDPESAFKQEEKSQAYQSEYWILVHELMPPGSKPPPYNVGNLIPAELLPVHYTQDGTWRIDESDIGDFDSVEEYALAHPEYVFSISGPNKITYVGIHAPDLGKELGAAIFGSMLNGGAIIRVNLDGENGEEDNDGQSDSEEESLV